MSAWRRIAIVLALGAFPACGEETGSLEAAYTMFELNGQPLPHDPATGCCVYTFGLLTLSAGNYAASVTLQDRVSSMISIASEQGTYSVNGSQVVFQRISGGTFNFNLVNGTASGRVIRVLLGGSSPGAGDQLPAAFRR